MTYSQLEESIKNIRTVVGELILIKEGSMEGRAFGLGLEGKQLFRRRMRRKISVEESH